MVARVSTLRSAAQNSRLVRVVCVALLVLFVLICGVHLMAGHQRTVDEGLGLTDGIRQLVILLGAALAAAALFRSQWSMTNPGPKTPSRMHYILDWLALVPIPLEAPLRR